NTDIYYHYPFFNHISGNSLGFPGSYNQYIGPPGMKSYILGLGMAYSYGGISPVFLLKKDIGYRFAHNVASTHNHYLGPFKPNPGPD
ncbi:unnamed protein product, partial [marine sediment metagenome]